MNSFTRAKDGVTIPLDKVTHFEPFEAIGNKCLKVLSEVELKEPISDQFLRSMAEAIVLNAEKVQFFVSCDQTEFAFLDNVYSKLLSWRNVGDKSYDYLVQLFAGFTMLRAQDLLCNFSIQLGTGITRSIAVVFTSHYNYQDHFITIVQCYCCQKICYGG